MQFNTDRFKNKICYSAALIRTNKQNMLKVCIFANNERYAYKLFVSTDDKNFFFRYPTDKTNNVAFGKNSVKLIVIQFMRHINEFVQNGNTLDGKYWKPILSVLPISDDPIIIEEYFLPDDED